MNNIWGNHMLKSVTGVKARTSGPLAIPRYKKSRKFFN